jgi:patatin-related protein
VCDDARAPWRADIRKEIRFAVVLYGGVSLAVYISGVVRELLAMVRATAPVPQSKGDDGLEAMSEPSVTGSMSVYRELAQLLNAPEGGESKVVYTRFIVDVISGTSAGGLNGIYLAKALAKGRSLDHLRKFWLDRGDILGLLAGMSSPARSLLSGDDMLKWLHQAFAEMPSIEDRTSGADALVDDVTCFATTTDLWGLPIYVRTSDDAIVEERHKNVFRFAFSSGALTLKKDDFDGNDSSLAFAARCTSSFPGAFAPAALEDLPAAGLSALTDAQRRRLFPDYIEQNGGGDPAFEDRFDARRHAFADGGILNNKPFVHAITALASARGGKPSERKLIYVEPSPESPRVSAPDNRTGTDRSRPAFTSVISDSFSLPRDQTIREEVRRIEDRNRLIDRMNGILADVPHEVRSYHDVVVKNLTSRLQTAGPGETEVIERLLEIASPQGAGAARGSALAFIASDVGEMMMIYGLGYASYHRVKVASVTDDLTSLVARLLGMPDDSDDWQAVRLLVRAWRDLTYTPYLKAHRTSSEEVRAARILSFFPEHQAEMRERLDVRSSENAFLVDFDLRFGLRRLAFLLNKIDDLFCMDDRAETLLRSFGVVDAKAWMSVARRKELGRLTRGLSAVYMMLQERLESLGAPNMHGPSFDVGCWERKFAESVDLRTKTLEDLPSDLADVRANTLPGLIEALGVNAASRKQLVGMRTEAMERTAFEMVWGRRSAFDAAAHELAESVKQASRFARRWCTAILPDPLTTTAAVIDEPGQMIRFLYDRFEYVDRITFPVFYQTDVGQETDIVSLLRISPDDAVTITAQPRGEPVQKLGGERLGHFGGFFSRQWRASDFMWGQLDAAERLITEVAKGSTLTDECVARLISDAQLAILADVDAKDVPAFGGRNAEERLEQLKDMARGRALVAIPKDLEETIDTGIAGALPIVSRLLRSSGSGMVGRLSRTVGMPLVYLARSTYDRRSRSIVFGIIGLLAFLGILSMVTGLYAARATQSWPGSRTLFLLVVIGWILGGLLLFLLAGGIHLVRSFIERAIINLRRSAGQ